MRSRDAAERQEERGEGKGPRKGTVSKRSNFPHSAVLAKKGRRVEGFGRDGAPFMANFWVKGEAETRDRGGSRLVLHCKKRSWVEICSYDLPC